MIERAIENDSFTKCKYYSTENTIRLLYAIIGLERINIQQYPRKLNLQTEIVSHHVVGSFDIDEGQYQFIPIVPYR